MEKTVILSTKKPLLQMKDSGAVRTVKPYLFFWCIELNTIPKRTKRSLIGGRLGSFWCSTRPSADTGTDYNLHHAMKSMVYTVFRVRRITFFQVNRVEHQKLNQTTPYGAVWLSFWCSTRPSADGSDELVTSR